MREEIRKLTARVLENIDQLADAMNEDGARQLAEIEAAIREGASDDGAAPARRKIAAELGEWADIWRSLETSCGQLRDLYSSAHREFAYDA
jgi:hypothetical protein